MADHDPKMRQAVVIVDDSGNMVDLSGLASYTDGLETLLTAISGYVDGLEGFVDGLEGVLGVTTGAAVISDANGTNQQYLRGLVSMIKGSATSRLLSAANTTNSTLVKNAAGVIQRVSGYNAATDLRYLKFYNKATAPTVGSDTPVLTIALPALTAFDIDIGLYCGTGIGFGLVTAAADASTAAPTAGDVTCLNVIYS